MIPHELTARCAIEQLKRKRKKADECSPHYACQLAFKIGISKTETGSVVQVLITTALRAVVNSAAGLYGSVRSC